MVKSILEITQQDLSNGIKEVSGRESGEANFAAARACLAHTVYAGIELAQDSDNRQELLEFLTRYSIFSNESNDTDFFKSVENSRGWSLVGLSGKIRERGLLAVVQNLNYDLEDNDLDLAEKSGRVAGILEKTILEDRARFGGKNRISWLMSLKQTLDSEGLVIPIIQIPRMDDRQVNGHSVLVLDMEDSEEGLVKYFDPDAHATRRYLNRGLLNHGITRVENEPKRLIYTQSKDAFLLRMTGEVIHIMRSPNTSNS